MRTVFSFFCSAVLAAAASGGPTAYNIVFNIKYGGPTPTGSFVYDPATGFSNFIVQWNGLTYNLTAPANNPIANGSVTTACSGVSGPALGWAIMSQTVSGCASLNNYAFGVVQQGLIFGDLNQPLTPDLEPSDVTGIGIAQVPQSGNVNVEQYALGTWTIVPEIGGMAQLSSGGGWDTLLTLVNTGGATSNAMLNFYDNNGAALSLPVTFPQGALLGQNSTTTTESLSPFQMLEIDTNDTADAAGLT